VEYFFGISKKGENLKINEFERDKNGVEIKPNNKINGKWNSVFSLRLFPFHTPFRGRAQRTGFRNSLAQWSEGDLP